MSLLEKFTTALTAANIPHEVHDNDSYDTNVRKLVGVHMGKTVWAWFSYENFTSQKDAEFLSFDHAYSRNTGKSMRGIMKRIEIMERIQKKTGYEFYPAKATEETPAAPAVEPAPAEEEPATETQISNNQNFTEMADNSKTLHSFPLTMEDADLITFALRRLAESTGMANIKTDAENLLEYMEREKKEKK